MKHDYNELDESTNVVKSNFKRSNMIALLVYLLVWATAIIAFWFFTDGSDAMGYSLLYLWGILPVTTLVVSILIGKGSIKGKWVFALFFGVMYMLAEYCTFKMANNISFHKLNAPDWGMLAAGAIISFIGMLVGEFVRKKTNKKQ